MLKLEETRLVPSLVKSQVQSFRFMIGLEDLAFPFLAGKPRTFHVFDPVFSSTSLFSSVVVSFFRITKEGFKVCGGKKRIPALRLGG